MKHFMLILFKSLNFSLCVNAYRLALHKPATFQNVPTSNV